MADLQGSHDIHISIVSHGHGDMLARLLLDLASSEQSGRFQLSLTHNILEGHFELPVMPFPVHQQNNSKRAGFAHNHNQAFAAPPLPDQRRYFLALNPDIRLGPDVIAALVAELDSRENCGLLAPLVVDSAGQVEQSARSLPSLLSTALRFLSRQTRLRQDEVSSEGGDPDWVAGMALLFPADVYEKLGGFDEAYHLYYEDVDISCRVWLSGKRVCQAGSISVTHDGQWQSRGDWRHMLWHITSALRFFLSPVYRQARQFQQRRHAQQ